MKHKNHLKEYEILVPVRETWVFYVKATSKNDALARHNAGESEQNCSLGGWPRIKKGKLMHETERTVVRLSK